MYATLYIMDGTFNCFLSIANIEIDDALMLTAITHLYINISTATQFDSYLIIYIAKPILLRRLPSELDIPL